jgi:mono/diheme cytochrome c family protein
MQYIQIFVAIIFVSTSSMGYSAAIPSAQLSGINSFAIVDNEGEQYIAATNQGLFHSDDHGHTWEVYEGYQLPATMLATTPQGTVYAFVVTRGLLQLNFKTNQWIEVNNQLGSQVLRQLTTTSWTPSRLVATNQYGKMIVSENHGIEWHRLSGPYQASSAAEESGHNLYEKKCQSCHGKDGAGETYTVKALTDKSYIQAPALDASAHAWHHTDEALAKTILEGSARAPRMAAWKEAGISEHDARDLVAYIKSLWSKRELECQGPKHMQCM